MIWFGEREGRVKRWKEGQMLKQNSSLLSLCSQSQIEEIIHQIDGEIDEEANDGERDYMKR